jgi:hypothetical protein
MNNSGGSNSGGGHLEEGDLLRLIDGEMPEAAVPAARAHIEACWTCRAQFQEIETAIGEYVRYQKAADPLLPPPPNAWPDLRFRPGPDAQRAEPPMARSRRWFDLRWALVAAAAVILFFVVERLDRVPTANAAGLLRKASAVEPVSGSIRVKTRHRTLVRPALLQGVVAGDDAQLRQSFERAHLNWEQPLSTRTYAAWRDQLSEKEDDVRLENSGVNGDDYVIRTTTRSGELHRATMTLRARDLRPIREMLEFTSETVELEQVTEAEVPAKPLAASPTQSARGPEASAEPEKSESLAVAALHRMLQVFLTLHRQGADLGEPVEISQDATGLKVTAIGLSPSRHQQLQAALEKIPSVVIRFEAGAPHQAIARKEVKNRPSEPSPAQSRLQELLGSAQAAENLTDRALDASDSVLARVHALRALAEAFPPVQESVMSTADRHLLADLWKDHALALPQSIADLRTSLQPVIGRTPRDLTVTPGTAGSWQDDVQKLFQAAQRADQVLNRELAGDAPPGNGFGQISTALDGLERASGVVTRRADTRP